MSLIEDASPELRAYRAKATPPHLRALLDELIDRMVQRNILTDEQVPGVPIADRFHALMNLGSGGYGCVVEALDTHLKRPVALKLCVNSDPKTTKVLLAEAQTLAGLSHPNIITIHDTGEYEDNLFLVMEFAAGGSLNRRALVEERMPWRRLVPIFADVARGLAAAHAEGVIHGDIKPSNILLRSDGRPCVADFGLARIVGAPPLIPNAIGTRAYVAPEVFAGAEPDAQSDQWSLFVTLWECLEWRLPYITDKELVARAFELNHDEMLWRIRRWAGPSTLDPDLPEPLREAVAIGLSLDPAARFPNMSAVAEAFEGVMAPERLLVFMGSDAVRPELPVRLIENNDDQAKNDAIDIDIGDDADESIDNDECSVVDETPKPDPVPSDSVVAVGPLPRDDAAEPPSKSTSGDSSKGLGIVIALVVLLGGLLAQIYLVKHDAETEQPSRAMRTPTPAERGEQKIQAASEIVKSTRLLTDQKLDLTVEIWRQGADLIRLSEKPSDKALASKLTLALATQIQARKEGTAHAAQLATQAAQWREAEGQWTEAAAAQEQAVKIYESAEDAPGLRWAEDCLANLQAEVKCEKNSH